MPRRKLRGRSAFHVLIADLARFGTTLEEYLRMLPQAAVPSRPRVIEGGRRD